MPSDVTDQSFSTPRAPSGVGVRGPTVEHPGLVLLSAPVLAVACLLGAIGLLEVLPGAEPFRLLDTAAEPETRTAPQPEAPIPQVGEATLPMETILRPELEQPEEVQLPRASRGPIPGNKPGVKLDLPLDSPPIAITDPQGAGLDGFYRALARTARKEQDAITRIVHFGDSIVTSDYVTGTLRRKFQQQFGDAGHGYVLIANAWPAYFHNDVYRFASPGWKVSRIVGPLSPDGIYGLGGVSFRAPAGARARFGTAKKGKYGRAVSRFVLVYRKEPGGGTMRLNLDGARHQEIDTNAERAEVATVEIRVADGEHELELHTLSGSTRVFGVVLERDEPGVVLDAIGIQGARIRFLDKQDDAHWRQQLQWRQANLLVYQFGANESGDNFAYPMADYHRTMKTVLLQGKQALPEAGCLVIGAMDRAEKKGLSYRTMPVIPAIVAEQRRAAAEVGCAFFDTFTAMGGHGSMTSWVDRGLGQADLTHPTGVGSEVLARWIFQALMHGFHSYLERSGELSQ